MAKKPEERYPSAGEFARALEGVAIGPSQVAEPTVTTPVAVPFEPAGGGDRGDGAASRRPSRRAHPAATFAGRRAGAGSSGRSPAWRS